MIQILRTDSSHPDFQSLVRKLDAYLAKIDGEETVFYSQYNKINALKHAVVVFENDTPLACGAIKEMNQDSMEVKRMFTSESSRGKGLAKAVLSELENWAKELGYRSCVLETGKRMPDAIALYHKCGYQITPNYGQYIGIDNSVCFKKELR